MFITDVPVLVFCLFQYPANALFYPPFARKFSLKCFAVYPLHIWSEQVVSSEASTIHYVVFKSGGDSHHQFFHVQSEIFHTLFLC